MYTEGKGSLLTLTESSPAPEGRHDTVPVLQEVDILLREHPKWAWGSEGKPHCPLSPSEPLTACHKVCTYIHCIMHVFRARNAVPRGWTSSAGGGVSDAVSQTVWDGGRLHRCPLSHGFTRAAAVNRRHCSRRCSNHKSGMMEL